MVPEKPPDFAFLVICCRSKRKEAKELIIVTFGLLLQFFGGASGAEIPLLFSFETRVSFKNHVSCNITTSFIKNTQKGKEKQNTRIETKKRGVYDIIHPSATYTR